jgi:polyphosphate glucokinase
MKVLVVDVGGSHVKMLTSGRRVPVRFDSGAHLTPARMVHGVKEATKDWTYDAVTIGYPGPVVHGRILGDPHNLGHGWTHYDFAKGFGKPVRIVNDAAMQALGSYEGGRMLFLGLGTGLGTALVDDGHLHAMELAHLPYKKGKTYEDFAGERGLKHLGRRHWERYVHEIADQLSRAFLCDYVVYGGGNARLLRKLPSGSRLGKNTNAFRGGLRLWEKGRETETARRGAGRRVRRGAEDSGRRRAASR